MIPRTFYFSTFTRVIFFRLMPIAAKKGAHYVFFLEMKTSGKRNPGNPPFNVDTAKLAKVDLTVILITFPSNTI